MTIAAHVNIDKDRIIGRRNPMIFGQFIEHFHRQIYGGIFQPGSPLSDARGFRRDVIEALKKIRVPVVRWPGGCFASGYHWKDGVGKQRRPLFDLAWRVEEPNTFGTDEFVAWCREVGAEPFICTNAGTGTPEEMAHWVEYCNLRDQSPWARQRIENGHSEPHNVRYWSIGNENYGKWEIGNHKAHRWGHYVFEAAKMMKRVDPTIEITAAAYFLDFDWIRNLLTEAASVIDWISIHCYWADSDTPYETCVARSDSPESILSMMAHYLGATGHQGAIKVAFDEWNLRFWHIPKFHDIPPVPVDHGELAANDDDSVYTMADAVFTARFLMSCLRHPDLVQMANYAPTVNTRGLISTHPEGLVLRSNYHVFDLFANHSCETVLDAHVSTPAFPVGQPGTIDVPVDHLDAVVTLDERKSVLSIIATNLHPDQSLNATIHLLNLAAAPDAVVHTLTGDSPDAYNDMENPQAVSIHRQHKTVKPDEITLRLGPHSVTAIVLQLDPVASRVRAGGCGS